MHKQSFHFALMAALVGSLVIVGCKDDPKQNTRAKNTQQNVLDRGGETFTKMTLLEFNAKSDVEAFGFTLRLAKDKNRAASEGRLNSITSLLLACIQEETNKLEANMVAKTKFAPVFARCEDTVATIMSAAETP